MSSARRFSLALVAAVTLLVAGCGGGDDSDSGGSSSQSASGGSPGAVTIRDFAFHPGTDTVKKGASVTVTNDDNTAHTATSDDDESFDSGTIDPGSSGTISVDIPAGRYPYHCSIHPFMHGTLVVK